MFKIKYLLNYLSQYYCFQPVHPLLITQLENDLPCRCVTLATYVLQCRFQNHIVLTAVSIKMLLVSAWRIHYNQRLRVFSLPSSLKLFSYDSATTSTGSDGSSDWKLVLALSRAFIGWINPKRSCPSLSLEGMSQDLWQLRQLHASLKDSCSCSCTTLWLSSSRLLLQFLPFRLLIPVSNFILSNAVAGKFS